jgi:nitrate reductase NapE component
MAVTRAGYEAQERRDKLEIQKLLNALFIWKCYTWIFFGGFVFIVGMTQYTKSICN